MSKEHRFAYRSIKEKSASKNILMKKMSEFVLSMYEHKSVKRGGEDNVRELGEFIELKRRTPFFYTCPAETNLQENACNLAMKSLRRKNLRGTTLSELEKEVLKKIQRFTKPNKNFEDFILFVEVNKRLPSKKEKSEKSLRMYYSKTLTAIDNLDDEKRKRFEEVLKKIPSRSDVSVLELIDFIKKNKKKPKFSKACEGSKSEQKNERRLYEIMQQVIGERKRNKSKLNESIRNELKQLIKQIEEAAK